MKFFKKNYKIILGWLSKKTHDPVLRFICLWIALNHWYKFFYEKSKYGLSEGKCVKKIKKDYQVFHYLLNNQNLNPKLESSLVKAIKAVDKLGFKHVPKLILSENFPPAVNRIDQSQKNYEVLVECLYELRNKIFHGDVSIDNINVKSLARNFNWFLEYFASMIILNPKVTR